MTGCLFNDDSLHNLQKNENEDEILTDYTWSNKNPKFIQVFKKILAWKHNSRFHGSSQIHMIVQWIVIGYVNVYLEYFIFW